MGDKDGQDNVKVIGDNGNNGGNVCDGNGSGSKGGGCSNVDGNGSPAQQKDDQNAPSLPAGSFFGGHSFALPKAFLLLFVTLELLQEERRSYQEEAHHGRRDSVLVNQRIFF